MQLSDLFTALSHTELAGLMIGSEGTGVIEECHHKRLVTLINQSLDTLHGRFLIRENEVRIRAYDHITRYPLEKQYAEQDATVISGTKFIQDTSFEPFQGDVIKILEVYDEGNHRRVLNQPLDPLSLFTPSPKVLQIPFPVDDTTYFILYQATHPDLVVADDGTVDLTQSIDLPDLLHPALQRHVASKIFSSMNGQDHISRAAEHMASYELICSELETNDLMSTSRAVVLEKFEERGWV